MAKNTNRVQFGASNLHVAFITADGTAEAAPEFETPIHIPGLVNISLDVEGTSSDFFADNSNYFNSSSNTGYSGSIEVALFPDEVLAEALGWRVDSTGGLVEIQDGKPKPFALGFQIEGDVEARGIWLYNVKINRPGFEASTTEDSIEVKTQTSDFKATQQLFSGEKVVRYVNTASPTFFATVPAPAAEQNES